MELIVDTNVILAVVLNEPQKDLILGRTTEAILLAPEVLPYEIGNALSAMVKRHNISKIEALKAEKAASRITVRLLKVDIQAALELALEYKIYAYDAYFLYCATTFSLPLLTLDKRMKQVAKYLKLVVWE